MYCHFYLNNVYVCFVLYNSSFTFFWQTSTTWVWLHGGDVTQMFVNVNDLLKRCDPTVTSHWLPSTFNLISLQKLLDL